MTLAGTLTVVLLLAFTPVVIAEDVRVQCLPRTFQVVPGEPIRVELTVQTNSATTVHWHIPTHPVLKVRAIERRPVRRTSEGTIVYQRVVMWQGLEPATLTVKDISIKTQGRTLAFPAVSIRIRDPGS